MYAFTRKKHELLLKGIMSWNEERYGFKRRILGSYSIYSFDFDH